MESLKVLRKRKGLRQKDVAQYLGVTESGYNHYESGRVEPNIDTLNKLAELYECTVEEIINPPDQFPRQIVEKPEIKPEREVFIPLVASLRCGAGYSGIPFEVIKPIPVPETFLEKWGDDLQALIAVGESMIPTIVPGDLLICKPTDEWENGNVVSVNYQDNDMIKRIFRSGTHIELRSDNPKFPTIVVTDEDFRSGAVHVLGRVLIPIGQEL